MPVDRSLLPPLPGKPEWYVENAPTATDSTRPITETQAAPLLSMPQQAEAVPSLLPSSSPLAAPQFPTAGESDHAKKGRMKALAGRFRH